MFRQKSLLHSDFHLPYNPKLVVRAKELRKNMTPTEEKLWNSYLKNLEFRFLRQRPINNFIVDFYCANLKLVIEVDGNSHFTNEGKYSDAERTAILEGYRLNIIRFTNDDVLNNFESVCQQIEEVITLYMSLNPPYKEGL
ncbi:MAG: endonuclease domain-containing protein [Nostoc sp. C3-bin3]|nr:endonuclease domain-containing protein [Nostoc sp. C3-bin3]